MYSSGPELTMSDRKRQDSQIGMFDREMESRYLDRSEQYRSATIIFDILSQQNYIDSKIADDVRVGRHVESKDADSGPLQLPNDILASAGLSVFISMSRTSELLCTNSERITYPASQMSDGEKSALLLIGDVLVADQGTIHLVDEPERHLHRAISAPLIAALIRARPEDSFVVSTHDLDLAQMLEPLGSTFALYGCSWTDDTPTEWDLRLVPDSSVLSDEARRAILGGRTKIAFHEGDSLGLDHQIFRAVLKGWEVTPASSCANVLKIVAGLRNSEIHHWIRAVGIVDKDFRREVAPDGIFILQVHEIENCLYLPFVIDHLSRMQAETLSLQSDDLAESALSALRDSMREPGVKERIVSQKHLQEVREFLTDEALTLTSLPESGVLNYDLTDKGKGISEEYDDSINDLMSFLMKFPIRESRARDSVARALHFPNKGIYEIAAIALIQRDVDIRTRMAVELGIDNV